MKYRAAFAILVTLITAGLAAAQETTAISPALDEQMNQLEAITRSIRELDGASVARAFPTREETIDYLRQAIDEQLPADQSERYMAFYRAFDLLDAGSDLRAIYLELLGSQVAGFYDTDTRIMNVVPISGEITDELSFMEQIVYVHEYTHALQDQFFGLDDRMDSDAVADNPDLALATLALVEGDATAVMNIFTEQVVAERPLAALSLLGEGLQAGNLFIPPGTPDILARELLFPYEGGLIFVSALHDAGGWQAVNDAFASPPVASEQILHPAKYLAGEQPVAVTLADGGAALGEGWTQVWDTTLGEWYLREHLRTQLPRAEAANAAAGWGGDHFQIFAGAMADDLAWVIRIVWDTEADAGEFGDAYTAFGDQRFEAQAQAGCWSNADTALCVAAGAQDTLIAQAPALVQAQALLAAQQR